MGSRTPALKLPSWVARRYGNGRWFNQKTVAFGLIVLAGGSNVLRDSVLNTARALRVAAVLLFALIIIGSASAATGNAVVQRINTIREYHGLTPLAESSRLHRAAQLHAMNMARRDYFGHFYLTPYGWFSYRTWIARNYPLTCGVGENVALDYTTTTRAANAFMASPPHRANILNRNWRSAGASWATGSGHVYLVVEFGGCRF